MFSLLIRSKKLVSDFSGDVPTKPQKPADREGRSYKSRSNFSCGPIFPFARFVTIVVLTLLFSSLLPGERAAAETEAATEAQGKSLKLVFRDETGKPIPGAAFSYFGDPKPHEKSGYRAYVKADENGTFLLRFPPDRPQKTFTLIVESPGYAPYHAGWDHPETDPIPETFSITLEKAATIGGIVLGDEGKPLAGAKVEFSLPWGNRSRIKQPNHYVCGCRTTTDENGLWKYASVPFDRLDAVEGFRVTHPDYRKLTKSFELGALRADAEEKFTQSMIMEHGITVRGRVVNEKGEPVGGAVVVGRTGEYGDRSKTETDENGAYVFKNWSEARSAYLAVWKAGFMAVLKDTVIEKEKPPIVDFVVKPAGKPVRIKIVDKNNKPIKGFYLAIERWGAHRLVSDYLLTGTDKRPRTDENGCWTWKEAPEEEVVLDMFFNERHMDIRNRPVTPRDEEYLFVSEDPLSVSGKVTDAATGELVPAFQVYFGRTFENSDRTYWEIKRGAGARGTYRVVENDLRTQAAVKIEAEGYETTVSREIQWNEGTVTVDFVLKKLSPDKTLIRGLVRTSDGRPAAGTRVAMATHGQGRPYIQNGRVDRGEEPYTVSADKDGRFTFPYIDFEAENRNRHLARPDLPQVDFILFFLHDAGFKRVTQQEWETRDKEKPVTLEPWGQIEGTVRVGTRPGADLPLHAQILFTESGFSWGNEPYVFTDYGTTSDASGRFVFERVIPAYVTAARTIRFNDTGSGYSRTNSHSSEMLKLEPGATLQITLGGIGRPVVGRLSASKEFPKEPDWNFAHIECTPVLETFDEAEIETLRTLIPETLREEEDREKQAKRVEEWKKTEDGKKYAAALEEMNEKSQAVQKRNQAKRQRRRVCAVAKDGTFRLDDLFEGDWRLEVVLDSPPPPTQGCGVGERIGKSEHTFHIGAIPNGTTDEPLDLGSLEVAMLAKQQAMPRVGEPAPAFRVDRILPISEDGKSKAPKTPEKEKDDCLCLEEFQGKYVILDFWAMWCGPCLANLPELKKFHETIKEDDRFVLIGISLDDAASGERLGKFIAKREMNWHHGLAGGWEADIVRHYGVRGIPALFLIGPDGNVLLSNPTLRELVKKVNALKP